MGKYFRGHLKRNQNPGKMSKYDCLPELCYFLEVNLILGTVSRTVAKPSTRTIAMLM